MADVPPKSPWDALQDFFSTVSRSHTSAPLRHSTLTPTQLNTSEASSPVGAAGDVVSVSDSAPAMHAGVPILEQFRAPPAARVPSAAQHSPLPPSSPAHSDHVFVSAPDDASVSRQHIPNSDDSSYMPYHHSSEPTLSTSRVQSLFEPNTANRPRKPYKPLLASNSLNLHLTCHPCSSRSTCAFLSGNCSCCRFRPRCCFRPRPPPAHRYLPYLPYFFRGCSPFSPLG